MNLIAKYRKRACLTQAKAAAMAGWGQSRWSGYETGDRTPNADDIKKILRVLSTSSEAVSFSDLFPFDCSTSADDNSNIDQSSVAAQ